RLARVEPQAPLLLHRAVALQTALDQDRADLRLEKLERLGIGLGGRHPRTDQAGGDWGQQPAPDQNAEDQPLQGVDLATIAPRRNPATRPARLNPHQVRLPGSSLRAI